MFTLIERFNRATDKSKSEESVTSVARLSIFHRDSNALRKIKQRLDHNVQAILYTMKDAKSSTVMNEVGKEWMEFKKDYKKDPYGLYALQKSVNHQIDTLTKSKSRKENLLFVMLFVLGSLMLMNEHEYNYKHKQYGGIISCSILVLMFAKLGMSLGKKLPNFDLHKTEITELTGIKKQIEDSIKSQEDFVKNIHDDLEATYGDNEFSWVTSELAEFLDKKPSLARL